MQGRSMPVRQGGQIPVDSAARVALPSLNLILLTTTRHEAMVHLSARSGGRRSGMRTLIDLFETFGRRGDQTAFVNRTGVRRIRYSYGEIADLSLRMARLLAD